MRQVTARREVYREDLIQNKQTLEILKTIKGVFDVPKTFNKTENKVDTKMDDKVKNETKTPIKRVEKKLSENNNSSEEKETEEKIIESTEEKIKMSLPIKKVNINNDLSNKITRRR